MSIIYLASPYTSDDVTVLNDRAEKAAEAAAVLMSLGHIVFSPIVHGHPIAQACPGLIPLKDHAFWMKQCTYWLHHSDKLAVLKLEGWQESKGVRHEIEVARDTGKEVIYIDHGNIAETINV